MSDTIKTTLSIIGAVIIALFISFCISMCFPSFRNKVNNALGGVPENEYNQSIIEKNNLYLEISLMCFLNQLHILTACLILLSHLLNYTFQYRK